MILWDLETGERLHILRTEVTYKDEYVSVDAVMFSADGSTLMAEWGSPTILVRWDLETGTDLGLPSGHVPVFSPVGTKLATEISRTVYLRDLDTGDRVHTTGWSTFGM